MSKNKQFQEALQVALVMLVIHQQEWKSLADSGDAGFWKAEEGKLWKDTEEAIEIIEKALTK